MPYECEKLLSFTVVLSHKTRLVKAMSNRPGFCVCNFARMNRKIMPDGRETDGAEIYNKRGILL